MAAPKNNQNAIKVKVVVGDDIRRWRYSEEEKYSLDALNKFVSSTFNLATFWLQFEDDEGDRLTLSSQRDFQEAYECALDEDRKSLKIYVIEGSIQSAQRKNKQQNEQQPASPQPAQSEPEPFEIKYLIEFFQNNEFIQLLPDLHRRIFEEIKKSKQEHPRSIEKIIRHILENEDRFKPIISHELYAKKWSAMIPRIADKMSSHLPLLMNFSTESFARWVRFHQSLYPHFKSETIKHWIYQLLQLLAHAMRQSEHSKARGCAFKDIVIDIEYPEMTDTGKVIHFGVECDLCGEYPIIGDRYKCSICSDWDCCTKCEPKHDHPLIKFKKASKVNKNAMFKGLGEIIQRLSGDDRKENDEQKESDISVDCICGAKMECIVAKRAYNKSNVVYCDECGVQSFSEMVYHCPNGYDAVHHRNGYDLCSKCAEKKVLNKDEEKEKEKEIEKEQEMNQEKEKEKEKEKEVEVEPEQDSFEYLAQLNQIKNIMAMEDGNSDDIIKQMLVEHKGDISRVVPLLLQ